MLPKLYESYGLSYDQILEGVEYMGNEYEKIIEIFNHQVNLKYPLDTSTTYFDCTNFYFEIDKEDEFRKNGPSKENRNDPIIGLGLLLDANQIPIGMKLYPGNESEKPVIRDVIKELKDRNQISGKTVQVADKGLNCAENIINALKNKDGYLFSKSVKQLPETEKAWVLLKDGYRKVILVTSEIKMSADDIYNTYHNLWRIEESFKVMKTYLDARPVYLQKTASIHGHFLICYLTILLIRLLQFKVLKNKYCTEKLINFIREFRIVKLEHNKYVNITSSSRFIKTLSYELKLPITNYFLNESQIKMMLNYKF